MGRELKYDIRHAGKSVNQHCSGYGCLCTKDPAAFKGYENAKKDKKLL